MQIKELFQFTLVGGTALALKFGYRKSIDLDLFSKEDFGQPEIIHLLRRIFQNRFKIENENAKWGLFCYIDDIKVEIVKYPHNTINNTENVDGVRLYSTPDIAEMKLNAMLGRGKKKDFWDLSELLCMYSLQELITFHEEKYPSQHLLTSIPQAITYFDDAEESEEPVSLKGQTWIGIKKHIQQKVRGYLS